MDLGNFPSEILIPKASKSVQPFLQKAVNCPFWPLINIIFRKDKPFVFVLALNEKFYLFKTSSNSHIACYADNDTSKFNDSIGDEEQWPICHVTDADER